MSRLTQYLVRLFSVETLGLFAVMLFLAYITQSLRLFDIVTVKGQDLFTLLGQSALTTPALGQAILSTCMGIGIVRALRELQATKELHAIHAGGRRRAIWTAGLVFTSIGLVLTALSTHYFEPLAKRAVADWNAEIAADLVGRTLAPNKFTEIAPHLNVVIAGRRADGTILGFFADDFRDPLAHKTYLADTAVLASDDQGYVLELNAGSLQYAPADGQYSEVAFNRYELSLERLSEPAGAPTPLNEQTSIDLLKEAATSGAAHLLDLRTADVTRVAALCLLALGIGAFPTAARKFSWIPGEAYILTATFADRATSAFAVETSPMGENTGPLLALVFALGLLLWRLEGWRLNFPRNWFAPGAAS